jgi:hypothetical protein
MPKRFDDGIIDDEYERRSGALQYLENDKVEFTTPPLDTDKANECIRAGGYVFYEFGDDDWIYSMTPRPDRGIEKESEPEQLNVRCSLTMFDRDKRITRLEDAVFGPKT